MSGETYTGHYKNVLDQEVIARILGVRKCPVDKIGVSLVNIRVQRTAKILPAPYFGVIYTPRLEICDEHGYVLKLGLNYRGIDDMTYKKYPEIQRVCPRCYSILLIFEKSGEKLVQREAMHGYYKFGGSSRDEDTNISTTELFVQASLSKAERVVITEKANGKAAVMSMFVFNGADYFFGGSKGDHYITPVKGDHRELQRLNRNLFAFYIFDVLTKEAKLELSRVLIGKENGDCGYTLCAEYEDGRHMVPLPLDERGDIVNDGLRFFGLVKNCGAIKKGITLCEDVSQTLNWFSHLGLPRTPYHVKEIDEFRAIKDHLREGSLKEGYVLHYQTRDSEGNPATIGVEKFKLWWYIVLRLLREFMRRRKNLGRRTWPRNLWKRLLDRNESYMKMDREMLQKWFELCCRFLQWFFQHEYDAHVELVGFESGSLGMGTMWREFLYDHPEIDDTFGFRDDPIGYASRCYRKGRIKPKGPAGSAAKRRRALVVFQGIPGLGKTTLSRFLVKRLADEGTKAICLEQDVFIEKCGLRKSGAACFHWFKEICDARKHEIIFLMRNNSSPSQFRNYAEAAKKRGWAVHVFAPRSLQSTMHLSLVCLQSVYLRSLRNDHPAFKPYPFARQLEITLAFLCSFERCEPAPGLVDSVAEVAWIKGAAARNEMAVFLRRPVATFLRRLLETFAGAENPFGVVLGLPGAEILESLMLEKEDYQSWRVPAEEVANAVALKLAALGVCGGAGERAAVGICLSAAPAEKTGGAARENMLCVAVVLDSNSRGVLASLLNWCGFDMGGLNSFKMDHLTMIYGNKNDREGKRIWDALVPMAEAKKSVGVLVKGVAFWPKTLICFTAQVRSEVSYRKGQSLLKYVYSRHPHVTAAVADNVLPVESIKLLKYLAKEEAGEGRVFAPLKQSVLLSGVMTVVMKTTGFSRI